MCFPPIGVSIALDTPHHFKFPMSPNIIVFSQMPPVWPTHSISTACRKRHNVLWRNIRGISTRTSQLVLENCCWGCHLYAVSTPPLSNNFSLFVLWVRRQSRPCLGICYCQERLQAGLIFLAHKETRRGEKLAFLWIAALTRALAVLQKNTKRFHLVPNLLEEYGLQALKPLVFFR